MRSKVSILPAVLAVWAAACDNAPGRILVPNGGTVAIASYVDVNADGHFTANLDVPTTGLRALLYLAGASQPTASAVTGSDGMGLALNVPAGQYRLAIDSASLGDSLQVLNVDSATFTVQAQSKDTVYALVRMTFPQLTVAQAKLLPAGKKLVIRGIALNDQSSFGGAIYVQDATGVIRAQSLRQQTTVAPGDSVQVSASTARANDLPVLTDGVLVRIRTGTPPTPVQLQTGPASTARGGTLDGYLVHVDTATLLSFRTESGSLILTLDDGSGSLEVNLGSQGAPSQPLPGARMTATGLLLPKLGAPGKWQLSPRGSADLGNIGFPTVTLAQARQASAGQTFTMYGIALNGLPTFGDGTVHIQDPTAAIRILNAGASSFPIVLAGDSLQVVAVVLIGTNGQPYLSPVTLTRLRQGLALPPVTTLFSGTAATANDGRLDAQQAKVASARIRDTSTVASTGAFLMHVDDGSGPLSVVLEASTGLRRRDLIPDARVDVTGLLVGSANGVWALKPRTTQDLTVLP